MKIVLCLFLLGLASAMGGCASLNADGQRNLGRQQRVFVEQRLNDNLGIHRAITTELRDLGYIAESGPLTMMPDDTQLVVTYDAREEWDFRSYLLELSVAVRPARDYHRVIASGRYFRPAITNKSSDAMVAEMVRKLFPRFDGK
jgi:hypothetical protein